MSSPDIRLLILDIDGVMTDGSILIDSSGREVKRFHVRDGTGIVAWQRCGYRAAILTGRPSPVTTHRALELGIDLVEQASAMDKLRAYENICARAGVEDENVAYVADDLADLPVLVRVAYPIAVADAAEEVRSVAHHVTRAPGGRGAVREAVEHLLKKLGRWEEVLEQYGL